MSRVFYSLTPCIYHPRRGGTLRLAEGGAAGLALRLALSVPPSHAVKLNITTNAAAGALAVANASG